MIKRLILPLVAALSILLVAQQDAHAFDPQHKPEKWAYQQGVINPEYLNLRRGLVGHYILWEGGGAPRDISSLKNHSTLPGGTQNPVWVLREFGWGLDFDGSNDVVDLPADSTFGTLESGPLSIATWFKKPGYNAANFDHIVQKESNGGIVFEAINSGATNALMFTVFNFATTNLERRTSNNAISLNALHHAVVTWPGGTDASDVHIYVDGQETGYQTTTNGVGARSTDNTQRWHISQGTIRSFNGDIYETRIYNRVLTPAEVSLLYQQPFADLYPAPELQAAAEQAAVATPQVIVIGWEVPRWATRWMWWL